MEVLAQLANRLRPRLEALYGLQAEDGMTRIMHVCSHYTDLRNRAPRPAWDERDAVLITYADHVRSQGEPPLATLHRFLTTTGLQRVCRVLHLLPFFPASSDDGFSVIDYRQVDAEFGTWADIASLRNEFELMFDLVLNHTSRHSTWFQQYLRGVEPYARYLCRSRSGARPKSRGADRARLALLTPFDTARGQRHVWTTFSDDQVDLNYREPRVLAEMVDILLSYIRRGAGSCRWTPSPIFGSSQGHHAFTFHKHMRSLGCCATSWICLRRVPCW